MLLSLLTHNIINFNNIIINILVYINVLILWYTRYNTLVYLYIYGILYTSK